MAKPLTLDWQKEQLPQEWMELRGHVDKLPLGYRDKLAPLCERLAHFLRLQGKLVRIAQDAVDQLQLDVKYLVFDLEATRRERDELKELLEEIEEENEDS